MTNLFLRRLSYYARVLIGQKPMGYSTVKLTLQIDCYHESYRWIKKRRQILTNHCKPYFLLKPLVTYRYCSKNAKDHRFSMGLVSCEACFFSQFTNFEYTKINQGNHKRPLHQEIASAKTAKRFPTVPCTVMSINKLLKYALYTEAKKIVFGRVP